MLPLPLAASLAALQLALAVGWLAYGVCLPPLVAAVGLPATVTPWILLLDQALFAVLDLGLALAMGPVLRARERTMPYVIPAMLLSVLAMLLLPAASTYGPVALVGALLGWVTCSAVLRAPVFLLFVRHVPPDRHPAGLSMALMGSGLAAAVAPFAQVQFKQSSPFSAFVLSSILLVAAGVALLLAERRAPSHPAPSRPAPWTAAELLRLVLVGVGVLALTAGAQIYLVLRVNPQIIAAVGPDLGRWVLATGGAAAAVAAASGGLLSARIPPPVLVVAGAFCLSFGVGLTALEGIPTLVVGGAVLAMGAASLAGAGALQTSALAGDPGRRGLFLGVWSSAGAWANICRLGLVATGAASALPPPALDLGAAALPAISTLAFLLLLFLSRRRWVGQNLRELPSVAPQA